MPAKKPRREPQTFADEPAKVAIPSVASLSGSPPPSDSDAAHVHALYARIYDAARRVPRGTVVTYGQLAELCGMPGAARVVGAAMRVSVPGTVPWQRIVGKRSRTTAAVSILDPIGAATQQALLEAEGVVFSDRGTIALATYGWLPVEEARPPRASAKRRMRR